MEHLSAIARARQVRNINDFERHILEFIYTWKAVTLDNLIHQGFIENGFYNYEVAGTPAECIENLLKQGLIRKASFQLDGQELAVLLEKDAQFTGWR